MASLRVPYKKVNNIEIPTDIYLPSSINGSKPAPILIMIHSGALTLGHAGMNNRDQIQDCTERGWIVLAIEHRLCLGVDILDGPMTDVRDALSWTQDGGLATALQDSGEGIRGDCERVMVMGTSSGGHLALCTAFDTPHLPLAILDFYGAKHFTDPFWTHPLSNMPTPFYAPLSPETITAVLAEKTIFTSGISLEGQASDPHHSNPEQRQSFVMHHIATGTILTAIWPSHPQDLKKIDPFLNISTHWPPVAIVHGAEDTTIPIRLSKVFAEKLAGCGIKTSVFEVQGEAHTFVGKMGKGSATWEMQRKGFEWLAERVEESYG